jgi:hypothetical protein
LQAQLKTAQSETRPKFLIELAKPAQMKNCFKKFPTLQKKIKNAKHTRYSMTRQLNTDNGLQRQRIKSLLLSAVWRNGGFSASYDSLVVAKGFVLRINICTTKSAHRKAAKLNRAF